MGTIRDLLVRNGYVKLSDYGLVLTPDGRILTTRPAILDDGVGGRIVGWLDGDLAAMELEHWQSPPAARRSATERPPAPPPLPRSSRMVVAFTPPAAPAPASSTEPTEDEWEWEIAAARARAVSDELADAVSVASPTLPRGSTPSIPIPVPLPEPKTEPQVDNEPEGDWDWQIAIARARAVVDELDTTPPGNEPTATPEQVRPPPVTTHQAAAQVVLSQTGAPRTVIPIPSLPRATVPVRPEPVISAPHRYPRSTSRQLPTSDDDRTRPKLRTFGRR